jgi:hypothetical protein
LRPLGKYRRDFVDDVRKLYSIIRQQEYEAQGKRLPVGELLSLDEEKSLGKYLYQMASCLNGSFRENIHIFEIDSSKSLKETIYGAFVQGKFNFYGIQSETMYVSRSKVKKTLLRKTFIRLGQFLGGGESESIISFFIFSS